MSTQVAKIGDLSAQIRGVSYSKGEVSNDAEDGLKPILRAGNITEEGLTRSDLQYVPIDRISANQLIRRGDVVIAASTGSRRVIGKAAQAKSDFDGAFGAFCKVLRPNEKVDHSYFGHYFQTRRYREKVASLAGGANINNLRNEHLNDLEVPLPPLEEQRRIAAILDKADDLRTKRREAIAKLDTLAQSILIDMFGDPVTNPMGWPEVALGEVCEINPKRPKELNIDTIVSFLPMASVSAQTASTSSGEDRVASEVMKGFTPFKNGDLLIAKITPSFENGKIAQATIRNEFGFGTTEVHVVRPTFGLADALYLLHFLRQKKVRDEGVRKMTGSAGQKRVPARFFSGLMIPLPPLEEQRRFGDAIARLNQSRDRFTVDMDQHDRLFSSLQQRAFKGEL